MVHRMYSRYWVTYGNNSSQYKASMIPVQFQSQHLLQDHHTLNTSTDDGERKAGKSSTCKCTHHAKYFMEWTSSTLCTCPQGTASGSEIWRLISLEKSPAPTQWKDFCEQTPIDKATHSVTLFQLL